MGCARRPSATRGGPSVRVKRASSRPAGGTCGGSGEWLLRPRAASLLPPAASGEAQMTGPLLSLTGVSRSYRRGRHELRVLIDASLHVSAGEIVAVQGQRGAGKTTL